MVDQALKWKVYYADGSVVSSNECAPNEVEPLGIQAVVQLDSQGLRHIITRCDYYYYEDGYWFGADMFGLYEYLMRSGLVKFGRMLSHQRYDEILANAKNDPDFPGSGRTDELKAK